jgi:hypothetical protein
MSRYYPHDSKDCKGQLCPEHGDPSNNIVIIVWLVLLLILAIGLLCYKGSNDVAKVQTSPTSR